MAAKELMRTTHVPPSTCPSCGALLDAASARDARPSPGDYSICVKCLAVARFDAGLRLVALPARHRVPWHVVDAVELLRRLRRVH
jgi:hypothetical protein